MTAPTPHYDDEELAAYVAAQQREYGKWQAAELIVVGNAPAYNIGDPVPISNVDTHGYAKRGQVRLQPAYVEDNPDDPDVKTFLAYAEKYPEHPAARAMEEYRAARAEREQQARDMPPLVFGADEEPKSGRKTRAAPDAKTADPEGTKTTTTKG